MMNNLAPGGWVEMVDFAGDSLFSDDNSMQDAPHLAEWVNTLNVACHKFGKEIDVARHHKQLMIDTGFKNVREEVYKVSLLLYYCPVIYAWCWRLTWLLLRRFP